MTSGKHRSVGGVVFNVVGKILLFEPKSHYGGYAWTFPKGRANDAESPERTALREVKEETGVEAQILDEISGTFEGETTLNRYFIMWCIRESSPRTDETETVRWVAREQAEELISQSKSLIGKKRDLEVLDAGCRLFKPHAYRLNVPPAAAPYLVQSLGGVLSRILMATEGFRIKHGRWPTKLEIAADWMEPLLSAHLTRAGLARLQRTLRVEIGPDRSPLRMLDESGAVFDYSKEGPEHRKYEQAALIWLGFDEP